MMNRSVKRNKKHALKLLSAYCRGELPIEESRRLAEHLLICQRCQKEFEEIRQGVHFAGHLPQISVPASVWHAIEARLNQTANQRLVGSSTSNFPFVRGETLRSFVHSLLRPVGLVAVGALLLLLIIWETGVWRRPRLSTTSQEVTAIEGRPKIGSERIEASGRLTVGKWLETDSFSRARIQIGAFGRVEVEPNTRLRLLKAESTEHRLGLAHGAMHAQILAPPRLFFVETPSAVAVDLGCAYTLEVDKTGTGVLDVTSGWVAFETKGRESIVPSDASCETRPRIGPGTPFFKDASEAFRDALRKLDFEKLGRKERLAALQVLLRESRPRDGLTLWHLLSRLSYPERRLVYERLAALVPPPRGVTQEGILKGDRLMLNLWWDKLRLGNTTEQRLRKSLWPPRQK